MKRFVYAAICAAAIFVPSIASAAEFNPGEFTQNNHLAQAVRPNQPLVRNPQPPKKAPIAARKPKPIIKSSHRRQTQLPRPAVKPAPLPR